MRSLVATVLAVFLAVAPSLCLAQTPAQPPAASAPSAPAKAEGDASRVLGIGFGMVSGALAFHTLARLLDTGLPVAAGAAGARSFAAGAEFGFRAGLWQGVGIFLAAVAGGAIGNWLYGAGRS